MRRLINLIKIIKLFLYGIWIIPHILIFKYGRKDMEVFRNELSDKYEQMNPNKVINFVMWMYFKPYLRNLFYHRAGGLFKELFAWMSPEDRSLHLHTKKIGKGCHLEHSENSFIVGAVIGDNFYCLHNVTIGNDNGSHPGKPIIGNNVRVMTGAVVLGGITIGDNVTIAANAVVRTDVPDNVLVGGIPAKILKYNQPPESV